MKFTIRDLLWLTVVVALAIGWWVDRVRQESIHAHEVSVLEVAMDERPYKVQYYYANGKVSMQWWERREADGDSERLWDLGSAYFYSNGTKGAVLYSGDESLSRYYSPSGQQVSAAEFTDFYSLDLGDGTFAKSLPNVDGNPSRLAKEFPAPPTH
jgi:hypothetical protein